MVLHIEQHIISFSVKNSIWDIFALILCPLLTKLRAAPWEIIVSFIKFLIVGSKRVDLETPVFISSSLYVDGESNIEQVFSVIINFYQHFVLIKFNYKPQ